MKISDIEDIDKLASKDDLRILSAELRAEFQKDFGDFRADITKTLWLSQLSMAAIIVALVGLMNAGSVFLIAQMVARIPHTS